MFFFLVRKFGRLLFIKANWLRVAIVKVVYLLKNQRLKFMFSRELLSFKFGYERVRNKRRFKNKEIGTSTY